MKNINHHSNHLVFPSFSWRGNKAPARAYRNSSGSPALVFRQFLQRTFLIMLLCLVGGNVVAQSDRYADYISQLRSGNNPGLPYDLLREQPSGRMVATIEPYFSDTVIAVRRASYQALDVVQQNSSRPGEKQDVLQVQFRGLNDEAPEIVGLTIDYLSEVPVHLFTEGQKSTLINLLNQPVPQKETLIRLVGTFGGTQAILPLQQLSQPGNGSKIRWAAYLALARLGEQSAIAAISEKVRALTVDSDVVYNIVPSLIYTRQKPLYDYLVEQLYSNERNCEPADPDQYDPINCAYRILEMLAPQIEGFPIATKASGDLDTRNYRRALQTAREWFEANKDYKILSE